MLIGLFFTAGVCGWTYTKLQRRSGNNTKQTVIALTAIAIVIFFLSYSTANMILPEQNT